MQDIIAVNSPCPIRQIPLFLSIPILHEKPFVFAKIYLSEDLNSVKVTSVLFCYSTNEEILNSSLSSTFSHTLLLDACLCAPVSKHKDIPAPRFEILTIIEFLTIYWNPFIEK